MVIGLKNDKTIEMNNQTNQIYKKAYLRLQINFFVVWKSSFSNNPIDNGTKISSIKIK
jgi:hypothetical protein